MLITVEAISRWCGLKSENGSFLSSDIENVMSGVLSNLSTDTVLLLREKVEISGSIDLSSSV